MGVKQLRSQITMIQYMYYRLKVHGLQISCPTSFKRKLPYENSSHPHSYSLLREGFFHHAHLLSISQ